MRTDLIIKGLKQSAKQFRDILYSYSKHKSNFFETDFERDALISYIFPGDYENNTRHQNRRQAYKILSVFKELNYNVDIFDYRYKPSYIDYSKYDVIFGFGEPFEQSFYEKSCSALRINYATGNHVCFANHAELKRLKRIMKRKGKRLKPQRLVEKTWSASTTLADAIICTGNKFTAKTYRRFFEGPVYYVPVSAFNFFPPSTLNRDISEAKNNFLWIGSSGLAHKGLDLVLEAFYGLEDKTLHIFGPTEKEFMSLYEKELNSKNIHYHGFVDVSSSKFKSVVERCAFTIFPSCSDGGPGSVLTAMMSGLIPIVTKEAGVEVKGFGFLIEKTSVDYIKNIIKEVTSMQDEEIIDRARRTYKNTKAVHNIDNFEEEIKEKINTIIEENNE